MALSGSVNTTSYDGRYYQLSWTATQDVASNKSTVSWTLKAVGGSSSWYAERTLKVVINGSTVFSKEARVERYTGNIETGTIDIPHNSDGSKSFSVSVQAAVYGTAVNCTGSKSFTLNTIARASTLAASNGTLNTAQTLTVTRQSTSFTHTITYKCGTASGTIESKSKSTSISWTPPLSLATQNKTGTSVTVTFTIETFNGSTSIGKKTKTITCAIPSSVKPSVSLDVWDGEGYASVYGGYIQKISKIAVTVDASGSQGSTIKTRKTTANGNTYTQEEFITDVISSSGTLTVSTTVTDSRGRTATASKTITVFPYSPPQIPALSVYRDSGGALNVKFSAKLTSFPSTASKQNTATYQIQYKKKSETSYSTINVTEQSGKFNFSNYIYPISNADTSSSYDVIVIATDAFDSTSMTASGSTSKKLFSIFKKGLGWAFGKVAEKENTVEFAFDASFEGDVLGNVLGLNRLNAIPENAELNDYKTTGAWSIQSNAVAATITCGGVKLGTDASVPPARACRFEVNSATGEGVSDKQYLYLRQRFIPYNDENATIERDVTRGSNDAWNYNPWWKSSLTPSVSEKVYSKSAMSIGLSANSVLGVVTTYTKIPFNTSLSSTNDRLTLSSNAIRIGKNIQHIKVSGQVLVSPGSTNGLRHVRLQKISGSTTTNVAWNTLYFADSRHLMHVFTPLIVSVKEGDLLQMSFYARDESDSISSGTSANGYQTYLTVEEL